MASSAVVDFLSENKTALVVGVIVVYIAQQILTYNRLRHIPGPWLASWSELPHSKWIFHGLTWQWYRDISAKYGPIARIGPTSVLTSSPEVWIHVNTKPGYKKSDWYFKPVRVEYGKDNIFSQTDTEKHDLRRKQLAPGYSGRENLELERSIDAKVQELLDLINNKYLSTDAKAVPMDLAKKIQFLTLDVISTVAFDGNFGMLKTDEDVLGFIKSSEDGLTIGNLFMAFGLSWLVQAPGIGKFLGPKPTHKTGFGAMMARCFKYIDERVKNPEDKRRDMLASFIRHGVKGDDLRSEVLEQLVAGSDTTAGALRAIMLHIIANPRVQRKLQKEIDEIVASGKVAAISEGIISQTTAKSLPYMQAVIREGLRVWPPVQNYLPKDVPKGGDTIMVNGNPVFLPEGTCIGISARQMHHDRKLYGEDAEFFRPERWLEEKDAAKLAAMTKVNNMSFGYGKWECLGKPVATMEINKTLFEGFRHFDWAIATPATPWEISNAFGLFLINKQWVQITARS
ncbi:cytochrome P450 [Podospora australis]|uniref:Cytochrome P450 monooxygenase ABA1 n=1 Tax=Podospora australis TaxID=1536484 RepID=A0AAN7AI89_9PEZI|nr:cytochrome P450 [Podospora australis]